MDKIIDFFQALQGQVMFAPATLWNMVISAVFGLIGGFVAHYLAARRDHVNWKRSQLLFFRGQLSDIEARLGKIERPGLALKLLDVVSDDEPKWQNPAERWLIVQGRKIKKQIQELELEIDS